MTMEWSLYTDLYQLTMAQGYLEAGKADEEATFNMYFRDYPFRGGYAIACGMAQLAEILGEYRFTEEDIAYLADIPAPGGVPSSIGAFWSTCAASAWMSLSGGTGGNGGVPE